MIIAAPPTSPLLLLRQPHFDLLLLVQQVHEQRTLSADLDVHAEVRAVKISLIDECFLFRFGFLGVFWAERQAGN